MSESFHPMKDPGYTGRMNVKDWHPLQLGVFWLVIALFGLPVWIGLSMVADFLAAKYPRQVWFDYIPIGLAFLVVFMVVGFGMLITSRWLDGRPPKGAK